MPATETPDASAPPAVEEWIDLLLDAGVYQSDDYSWSWSLSQTIGMGGGWPGLEDMTGSVP